jgi:DNA-binding CsgD family transcriptional regulator
VKGAIRLTARERDVLQHLARGRTYAQVGDQLNVSLNTVGSHVKNIYRKLEVRSARSAVWRALELQILCRADDPSTVTRETEMPRESSSTTGPASEPPEEVAQGND